MPWKLSDALENNLLPTKTGPNELTYEYPAPDGRKFTVPIIYGREEKRELIVSKCPLCNEKHWHSPEEGTRSAHCRRKYKGMYYVRPEGASGPFLPVGWTPGDVVVDVPVIDGFVVFTAPASASP